MFGNLPIEPVSTKDVSLAAETLLVKANTDMSEAE
jgi:hypothetical protein